MCILGVMGSDEFCDWVVVILQWVGENGWLMLLFDDFKDDLKFMVVDLVNVSGQCFVGMLVVGVFLCEFVVELVDWVYIDVVGLVYNIGSVWGYMFKGVIGVFICIMFVVFEDIVKNGQVVVWI